MALSIYAFNAGAQTSAIDEMFDKYSEREGFTSVYISSKMLGLFADKEEKENVVNRLKSIRILTVEDSLINRGLNFYNELSRKTNLSAYEELMVVRDANQTTRFLIIQKGDIITELLVIVGGPDDNTLISIKGDLDLKSISDLSRNSGIEELESLDHIKPDEKD